MMKKNLLSAIFILCTSVAMAGNKNNAKTIPPVVQPSVINTLDTIVFDLSQQILLGNNTSFPVSFLSDDTVFSIDFSFKYNQLNFTYDTIIDIASNLSSYSYYNTNDSTVRYTSFSLQQIANNTALASVHFTTLTGSICVQDFNTVKGYLNGDLCSIKIIPCISGSPSSVDEINNNAAVNIYPNPAQQILNIESTQNSIFELFDLNGKTVIAQTEIISGEKLTINIANIANGIYILKTNTNGFISNKKIAINN